MSDFAPSQIRAFRYWIQGYQNFYEPIVEEYFHSVGYQVLRHPAVIGQTDIQMLVNALFDGDKRLGSILNAKSIQAQLKRRRRLQPDFLLAKAGKWYLAELKSWGGFNRSGQFDLAMAQAEFVAKPENALFLLIDQVAGTPITGKILVVSSRSYQHQQVQTTLCNAYQTQVDLLYLDEIFALPQLKDCIERQLFYLDAAVAELRQVFLNSRRGEE